MPFVARATKDTKSDSCTAARTARATKRRGADAAIASNASNTAAVRTVTHRFFAN